MKKITCFLVFTIALLFSTNGFSQDVIYLKSGEKIEAKILEVELEQLKYKKSSNLEGPTYSIAKSEVHMILYENGESEIFKTEKVSNAAVNNPKIITKTKTTEFKRSRINVEYIGLADYGPKTVSFERLNKSGVMGLELPLNIHFEKLDVVGFSTGANLKFYPAGKGQWFFVGPSVNFGMFEFYYRDYYYGGSYSDTIFSLALGSKIGAQFPISKMFGLSISGNSHYVLPLEGSADGDFAYSINIGANFSF